MLANLISNAVQHGVEGAPVKVEVHGASDSVLIQVSKTGPVISSDIRANLFAPLRQAAVAADNRVRAVLQPSLGACP